MNSGIFSSKLNYIPFRIDFGAFGAFDFKIDFGRASPFCGCCGSGGGDTGSDAVTNACLGIPAIKVKVLDYL